jgi:uncharacterized protein YdiU (UPF0061 family)
MENIHSKTFKNEFVEAFDGDDSGAPEPRQTPGMLYSKAVPTPVEHPEILSWSDELADELGMNSPQPADVDILGGNLLNPTMYPYAACYAGHQFGNWAGQLGDGRAITLGEWINEKGQSFELQLKGAGPTPYSRRADGRAVLRSSVREYLMSEAMHHLGIPTTRALSLVKTGDQVLRDLFYDGNAAYEPGAIVARVAPSFLRFGSFEMLAARQEKEHLAQLVNWTIDRYYPHLQGENKVLDWFREVVDRTATMIVEWFRVGFVHGVMNTDNMSILGLTIDYGPFSFLDDYDPNFTPNTTDLPGRRYAFGRQHEIAYWNLGCLASAIAPLFSKTDELVTAVESFQEIYFEKYYTMMGNKLGLDEISEADQQLCDSFEECLSQIKPDMTIFYQLLINLPSSFDDEDVLLNWFKPGLYNLPAASDLTLLQQTISAYQNRINANRITSVEREAKMKAANPRFILRNYLLHHAITELQAGNAELFNRLKQALKSPYSNEHDEFFTLRPEWAMTQPGSSTLSCSS